MKKKLSFRKIVNTLHLWVGVPCALVLFIVCLTGTLYVFQKEITRWIDSDQYKLASTTGPGMQVDSLIATVESGYPGLKATIIQMPEKNDEAWLLTLAPPAKKDAGAEKADIKKRTRLLIVNPYTGSIQGDAKTRTYQFFEKVIELHRWLLLDHKIGAVITGTSALLFVLLEITGLMLWLPPKLKSWKKWNLWKPGFSVKFKANWKRVNHDLHKTLGFYTFFIITILGLTGPYFGFEWYKNGVIQLMGATPVKKEMVMKDKDSKKAGGSSVSLDSVIAHSNRILAYDGDIRINLPKASQGAITVLKVRTGFFASAAVDRIEFGAGADKATRIDRFADRSTGEKIISLMRSIHTGEIFGTFSKIIYLLACLIATSLPVTGVIIWLNKKKKKAPAKVALSSSYAYAQQ
jgi:uncharacterized iron-regulated membrane protein